MSGSARIKHKVVKATIENKDVLGMFQGALGQGDGASALRITYPKYLRMQTHTGRFVRLLEVLRDSRLMTELFPQERAQLAEYAAGLARQQAASFCVSGLVPDGELDPDYSRVAPAAVAAFTAVFEAAKKCSIVGAAVVTCNNLVSHKKSLADPKNLRDKFLVGATTTSLCPLPGLALNFRQLYIDDRLSGEEREFVLVVLHKLYAIGHDVYEAVSAPDVDVDEFVEVIRDSIGEVKKHVPRCDAAFDKIAQSVDLLKQNFGGYHREVVASGNPTLIMENFVLDVSKDGNTSPQMAGQFRRIIAHYQKMSKTLSDQKGYDPRLKTVFDEMERNFNELERKSKAADAEDADSDPEDSTTSTVSSTSTTSTASTSTVDPTSSTSSTPRAPQASPALPTAATSRGASANGDRRD